MARTYRRWKYRAGKRCPMTGKTSFRSTTAAREFVRTREGWDGDYARVYTCGLCGWHHLTSQRTNWELERRAAQGAVGMRRFARRLLVGHTVSIGEYD